MKYAFEMGSGAMIYIPSFIKISSGIRKLIGEIHRQHGDLISILLFFQNKESMLKIQYMFHKFRGLLTFHNALSTSFLLLVVIMWRL
jgi:hypothetical protein